MHKKYSTLERLALARRVSLNALEHFYNQLDSKNFRGASHTSSRLARVDDVVLRLEKAIRA
jgi:hypothetical protein